MKVINLFEKTFIYAILFSSLQKILLTFYKIA